MRALILALLLTSPAAAQDAIVFEAHRDATASYNQCLIDVQVTNRSAKTIDRMSVTVELVDMFGGRKLDTLRYRLIEPGRDRSEKVWSNGDCPDPSEAAKVAWSKGQGPVTRSAWVRLISVDSCTAAGISCAPRIMTTYPEPGSNSLGILPVKYEPSR